MNAHIVLTKMLDAVTANMHINQFTNMFEINSYDQFSQVVSQVINDSSFEQYIFKLLPNKHSSMDKAFVVTNYAPQWQEIYNEHQYCNIDPTIQHCYSSHFPLFWDQNSYSTAKQKIMYHQGKNYGLGSGLVFPIHGPNGEFGMMSFATKMRASGQVKTNAVKALPLLSVFVDYVFESSKNFTKKVSASHIVLTPREKEVINWCVEGKTSWEISKILSCSESTINFHLSNVRHKFNASNTQLAVVRALRSGLIQI